MHLSSFLVMLINNTGVFFTQKALCWFQAFPGFYFLPYNTFENPESTEGLILTVFWSEIFLRHNLLLSLLVWLSVWSLFMKFYIPWFPAFVAIPGNQPGLFRPLLSNKLFVWILFGLPELPNSKVNLISLS